MSVSEPSQLSELELVWVALQPFLKSSGYVTRPRYQPDWRPSWTGLTNIETHLIFEDAIVGFRPHVLDAVRQSDGLNVMLKQVREHKGDHSERHMSFFGDEIRGPNPRNHCLPLLEVLRPTEYDFSILVAPRLLPWDVWPFVRTSEITDFIGQLLEGLAFMHEHNFAHFDVGLQNVMMDGIHLCIEPHHPLRPRRKLNGHGNPRHLERYQSPHPIKYYFIDFEYSVHFDSFADRMPMKRPGAGDKTVPEEKTKEPCDPFAVDVYCAGNIIRTQLLAVYSNLEFVRELVDSMTQVDPSARPSASDAALRFTSICSTLSEKQLLATPSRRPKASRFQIWGRSGGTAKPTPRGDAEKRKTLLKTLLSTFHRATTKDMTSSNNPTTAVAAL